MGHDLERSRGRWYPKLDVQAGAGTDAHSSDLTRDNDEDNDWDGRTEAGVYLRQRLHDGGEALQRRIGHAYQGWCRGCLGTGASPRFPPWWSIDAT